MLRTSVNIGKGGQPNIDGFWSKSLSGPTDIRAFNKESQLPTAHVFIATSLDGFIARPDGDIDWLLQRDDPSEDHGYSDFIADKDVIVMGRGSYEKVRTFDTWFYDRPVVVVSEQLADSPVPEVLRASCVSPAWHPRI